MELIVGVIVLVIIGVLIFNSRSKPVAEEAGVKLNQESVPASIASIPAWTPPTPVVEAPVKKPRAKKPVAAKTAKAPAKKTTTRKKTS